MRSLPECGGLHHKAAVREVEPREITAGQNLLAAIARLNDCLPVGEL